MTTYMADLGAQEAGEAFKDYYVAAEFDTGNGRRVLTDPLEAPARFYTVTLV